MAKRTVKSLLPLNRKGFVTLEQVPVFVITLVLVATFIVIGAMIDTEFKTQVTNSVTNTTTYNRTYTAAQTWENITFDAYASNLIDFSTTITEVNNGTNHSMNSALTSTEPHQFAMYNTSANGGFNISYDWSQTEQDGAFNSTVEGLAGLQNLSEWQSIIAVVVAAVVIIGIIYYIRK